jgi:hypothetical protein
VSKDVSQNFAIKSISLLGFSALAELADFLTEQKPVVAVFDFVFEFSLGNRQHQLHMVLSISDIKDKLFLGISATRKQNLPWYQRHQRQNGSLVSATSKTNCSLVSAPPANKIFLGISDISDKMDP